MGELVRGVLLALGLAQACVTVTCSDLADDTCADVAGESVLLRAHHCPSGTYCNLTLALETRSMVKCEQFQPISSGTDSEDFKLCGVRIKQRDLRVGMHPKICSDDLDCRLEDGSLSSCLCGVSGLRYCAPELSSSLFNQYWQRCKELDGLVYRNEYYYWMWYLQHYFLAVSAPTCAWSVSIELLTFRYLDAFIYSEFSAAVALSALILVA